MIRIKSVWFKGLRFDRPGFSGAPMVCENGEWLTAVFRFSAQNMRWERIN